ncbi:MAG: response regulator [candidate division NC10 bacterium]|nr:response regulator [candidate division NC10 bacterium]
MTTRTILIVDDEPSSRWVFKKILDRTYSLLMAENGRPVLDILRQTTVDLILLDLLMPEVDGFKVLRRLKEEGATVPVIVATAHPSQVPVAMELSYPVAACVSKPIDARYLQETVAQVLGA